MRAMRECDGVLVKRCPRRRHGVAQACASALLRVGDAALRGLHSNQRTRWQRSSAPNAAAFIVKKAGVAD